MGSTSKEFLFLVTNIFYLICEHYHKIIELFDIQVFLNNQVFLEYDSIIIKYFLQYYSIIWNM